MIVFKFFSMAVLILFSSNLIYANDSLQVEFHIFSITGDVDISIGLNEDFDKIWDDDEEDWLELQGKVQLLDHATIKSGNDLLTIQENGCYWNGNLITNENEQSMILQNPLIQLIYSPTAILQEDELTSIKINSEQVYDYFSPHSGKLYELNQISIPTGLEIQFDPEKDDGEWVMDDMEIILKAIGNRELVPGVNFPVGKPILTTQEYELDLKTRLNKYYGILLQLDTTYDYILICFLLKPHS